MTVLGRVAAAVLMILPPPLTAAAQDAQPGQKDRPAQACVAVMLPSVQGVEGSASGVATAVRDLFVSFLTGPSIRTVALESRLPSQAALEAVQKDCGFVLIASVTKKRSGGQLSGGVGQAIGSAAWHLPYGGAATATGRAAAIAGAQALSGLASETRRKDEITLGYRVGTPESVAAAKTASAKAKATVDGEDLPDTARRAGGPGRALRGDDGALRCAGCCVPSSSWHLACHPPLPPTPRCHSGRACEW